MMCCIYFPTKVLAYDGHISKAKAYMRDPIRAARRAIKQNSEELSDLYRAYTYLYLVDEVAMLPSCSSRRSQGTSYPIQLEPNPKLVANVLLPFMNIVVMKALAKNGLHGLVSLLGLPPHLGIPESWRSSEPGLLHSVDDSRSIEDFVILQKILRKDDLNGLRDDASQMGQSLHSGKSSAYDNGSILSISALGLANIDLSPGDPSVAAIPMTQLELLFRERDPDREFGRLRRVCSGSQGPGKTLGLWTNVETIRQLKNMVELAELEEQLRELKLSLDKTREAASQYTALMSKRKLMLMNMPNDIVVSPFGKHSSSFGDSFDESPEGFQANIVSEKDLERNEEYRQSFSLADEQQEIHKNEKQDSVEPMQHQSQYPPERDVQLEISTHKMQQIPQADPTPKIGPDEAGPKKKMRKSKRRFRPWFTAC